jgi:hypothetical protein
MTPTYMTEMHIRQQRQQLKLAAERHRNTRATSWRRTPGRKGWLRENWPRRGRRPALAAVR